MSQLEELLKRAAAGEPVQSLLDEVGDESDQDELIAEAERGVMEAQRGLEDACYRAAREGNDDGFFDDECDQAARDLIDSRDRLLRIRDPESYNEKRQMGLLD